MVKHGRRNGVQRYRCTRCRKRWQGKRRPQRLQALLWKQYVWQRQTLQHLASQYGKSARWVRKQLDAASLPIRPIYPRSVVVICDATFFGRQYGILAVRCPHLKRNLYWKEITAETIAEYRVARQTLEQQGFILQAAVIDGKQGVFGVFADIPVQMCQFHQMMIIRRYLTLRPKLEAGKELRAVTLALPMLTEATLQAAMDEWHRKWENFLKERTYADDGRRWQYTHRRIRSAYRSLKNHLPYLFTYQRYPELNIPNTTNSLDGYFNRTKELLNTHSGMTPQRRYKMIEEILRH